MAVVVKGMPLSVSVCNVGTRRVLQGRPPPVGLASVVFQYIVIPGREYLAMCLNGVHNW